MESRVTFDLDWKNRPVIKAQISNGEDVRDKIAYRIKENLGLNSNLALVAVYDSSEHSRAMLEIRTINGREDGCENLTEGLCTEQLVNLKTAIIKELESREKSIEPFVHNEIN